MMVFQSTLEIRTPGQGFTDVTQAVKDCVMKSGTRSGLCSIFVQHTSASLVIQENADPAVLRDLARFMSDLVDEARRFEHDDEGPDDMPAHVRSALTKTSENIPISSGQLCLGTWQALYLWEHRRRPHTRRLIVHISGVA
ncbi:MAG: secondary thiamine-phosphate synthase enzyme YjbQ [Polyangiaceae bacterium]|nr:secondary thiamine-phosphate synthase enzyme YjbQ [Polyangiaceae bacterium]